MGSEEEPSLVIPALDADKEALHPVGQQFKLYSGREKVQVYRGRSAAEITLCQEIQSTHSQCQELADRLGIESEEEEKSRVKELIKQLHQYNEAKDLAQALLGRLALLEGCTTRELYPRFDLELDD